MFNCLPGYIAGLASHTALSMIYLALRTLREKGGLMRIRNNGHNKLHGHVELRLFQFVIMKDLAG